MRTTINVRTDLLRKAKRIAVDTDSTLNKLFEKALTEFLAKQEQVGVLNPVNLPRSNQIGGVLPGVDLDDTSSLLEILEASK